MESKVELIREIIAMYHTTRLSGVDFAEHVLTKPSVQKAFTRFEASLPGGWEDARAALAKRSYHVTERYLSGHRVCIGFENGADAFAAHLAIIDLTAPPASVGEMA